MDEDTLRRQEDNFEDESFLPNRHLIVKWGGVFVAVSAVCVLSWTLAEIPRNSASLTYAGARQPTTIAPRTPLALRDSSQFDPSKVIGTTGTPTTPDARNTQSNGSVLSDLNAILEGRSTSELVGRRVDMQASVLGQNNLVTFWVGSPEKPLLVVLHRDVRDGHQRQVSTPPGHEIATVERGQQATISGTLQRIPDAEGRFSWDLTRPQLEDAQARGVYLLADSVRPTP